MCGLSGFIGNSTDPEISFELFTNIFVNTQLRGVDAAGIYAVDRSNEIYNFKDGVPSEVLIQYEDYELLKDKDINLLIGHCRQTSVGVGGPENNINNHPFLSADKSIALMHNGRIDHDEYGKMAEIYKPTGNCDSEVILRYLEENLKKNINDESNNMLELLTHFVGLCPQSHYAISVAESRDDDRSLYLLRNVHRSLWYLDLVEDLNQIFFASTDEIVFTSLLGIVEKYINLEHVKLYKIEPGCIVNVNLIENIPQINSYQLKLHQKILLNYKE